MGSHKGKGASYQEQGTPPTTGYSIIGNPAPDCKGTYYEAGTFNGEKYYKRADNAFFLWWLDGMLEWHISQALGVDGLLYWYKDTPGITGHYNPQLAAAGTPTVT